LIVATLAYIALLAIPFRLVSNLHKIRKEELTFEEYKLEGRCLFDLMALALVIILVGEISLVQILICTYILGIYFVKYSGEVVKSRYVENMTENFPNLLIFLSLVIANTLNIFMTFIDS
jgi:hypothetical protein